MRGTGWPTPNFIKASSVSSYESMATSHTHIMLIPSEARRSHAVARRGLAPLRDEALAVYFSGE
jgi:hypothetical protein